MTSLSSHKLGWVSRTTGCGLDIPGTSGGYFCCRHQIQTGLWTRPASYPDVNVGSFSEPKTDHSPTPVAKF